MNASRFTIGRLLLVIAACGVGLAALKGKSLWFSGLFTATIVAFLVAALGTMFRRRPVRAFCTGAVLCGSVYLLVVYDRNTCNLLLTDKFLRIAAEWAYSGWASPPPLTAPAAVQASYQEFNEAYLVNWNGTEPRSVFAGVGHLMFSWLFALGGGLVARAFAAREGSRESRPPEGGVSGQADVGLRNAGLA
jgi:hypothetical protein